MWMHSMFAILFSLWAGEPKLARESCNRAVKVSVASDAFATYQIQPGLTWTGPPSPIWILSALLEPNKDAERPINSSSAHTRHLVWEIQQILRAVHYLKTARYPSGIQIQCKTARDTMKWKLCMLHNIFICLLNHWNTFFSPTVKTYLHKE